MCDWIAKELGTEVPLHFTAFHPDYRMLDKPRTPPATLTRARGIGLAAGLEHVYTGNVHDLEGDTTFCAGCGERLIERDWYELRAYRLDGAGGCRKCGKKLAGHFGAAPGRFGRKRIPIAV
jgi:pyruvate formate lyase activating enzyme